MPAFHEVRFPLRLSYGSRGGPERRTEIVTLGSGDEERNSLWRHSRRSYNVGPALRSAGGAQSARLFAPLLSWTGQPGRWGLPCWCTPQVMSRVMADRQAGTVRKLHCELVHQATSCL